MKMTQGGFSKAVFGFIMAGTILLSGCASTGSTLTGNSVSADPRLTQGNDATFFSKSGFTACAGAAGVGVLACALSNASDKGKCAIIAGISACGVAMGANYYYDQRRGQYANTAERLQVMSADIQKDTENVVARTETMQRVIRDDEQSIAAIQKAIKANQLDTAKAEQELAGIDKNLVVMRKELGNMRAKVSEYEKTAKLEREAGAGAEVVRIEQEIGQMNLKVAALQQEVDGLYSQRSAITLG